MKKEKRIENLTQVLLNDFNWDDEEEARSIAENQIKLIDEIRFTDEAQEEWYKNWQKEILEEIRETE